MYILDINEESANISVDFTRLIMSTCQNYQSIFNDVKIDIIAISITNNILK